MKPEPIYVDAYDGMVTMTKEDLEALIEKAYQAGRSDGSGTIETDLSDYSDRLWKNAYERGKAEGARIPSAEPEIIRCKDCKHWTQSTGKMKGYGLGRCDFHDADLVTCNGFCYWAERK